MGRAGPEGKVKERSGYTKTRRLGLAQRGSVYGYSEDFEGWSDRFGRRERYARKATPSGGDLNGQIGEERQ